MHTLANAAGEPQALSEISPRDEKWDHHRANAQVIGTHYDQEERFAKLGAKIASCSTALGFGWGTPNPETGETSVKLRAAKFCHVRHCPVCQWRRSLRNTARFFAVIPSLQEQFPKARWIFLTLTVRNCEPGELRATIKSMNAGWKRLIERKDWPALGWARATEVTRNSDGDTNPDWDGTAHPHFHVLMMVPASYFSGNGYVRQDEWAKRWQDAMRLDYLPSVDVRAVKSKKDGQTLQAAVVETMKYATKAEDSLSDPQWLYTITEQLHKLRFLATGGVLKGVLKEEVTDQEMISGDDQEEATGEPQLWFNWNPKTQHYARR